MGAINYKVAALEGRLGGTRVVGGAGVGV